MIGFKGRAEEAEKSLVSLKLELKRESILRKKAYNQIREMKGNIRVVARVRPAFVPGKGMHPSEGPPKSSLMVGSYTIPHSVAPLIPWAVSQKVLIVRSPMTTH